MEMLNSQVIILLSFRSLKIFLSDLQKLVDDLYFFYILDFGFARNSLRCDMVKTFCGSYAYACPEILQGVSYNGYAADIWRMGIPFFMPCLLTDYH